MTQLDLFAAPSVRLPVPGPADRGGGPQAFAPVIACDPASEVPEIITRAREINFAAGFGTVMIAIRPLEGQASEFLDLAESKVPGLRADRMRLLALASIVAAMDERSTINRVALAEALSYRPQWKPLARAA